MNSKYLRIEIGGVDYSRYMTAPITIQETGTEQLATAMVTLANMPTEAKFKPFTPVKIGGDKYAFLVANDSVKKIVGRGRWNHELTLIDTTKESERVMMSAKSFSQPFEVTGAGTPQKARIISSINDTANTVSNAPIGTYLTPIERTNKITIHSFLSVSGVADYNGSAVDIKVYYNKTSPMLTETYSTPVWERIGASLGASFVDQPIADKQGVYTVYYHALRANPGTGSKPTDYKLRVLFSVVDPATSRQPYTLYDALEILLETAEPLRKNETPRYRPLITEEQEARFKATKAPELHFSNGRSLYENLSVIGKIVHAIPRVGADGGVYFKDLGSVKAADLSRGKRFGEGAQMNAADFATALEANFANLINTDDESEGSVTEPYKDGFITMRSNDARIKEGTGYIPTSYPIAKIKNVTMRIMNTKAEYDITKYIFERQEYDLLSGYSGVFPYTKTLALHYTYGSQNIEGLWYRIEDAESEVQNWFKRYSITNIYNEITGGDTGDADLDHREIAYQVTYIPIINGRARQEKTENVFPGRLVMAHNQSANKLSAKAFGENMRGKIAMMANAAESLLYMFKDLSDVPKTGQLVDGNKYISTVTTRVFPHFCISQIELSENMNALGEYAELKTDIRQYEIPQGEDRFILLEEFCEIGTRRNTGDDLEAICGTKMKTAVVQAFGVNERTNDVTSAFVQLYDDGMSQISPDIALPAYSTSVGNSVYIGFNFADNYSAGSMAAIVDTTKKYMLSEHVPYGDSFFGDAKYMDFKLVSSYDTPATEQIAAHALPRANSLKTDTVKVYATTGANPLILNKDPADSVKVAYQMHFVSNDGFVIGSELARIMPFIRTGKGSTSAAQVYFYSKPINAITGEADEDSLVGTSTLTVGSNSIKATSVPTVPFQSWVIKRTDGKCLIGKNSNSIAETIYFNFIRKR
jgi:hypothetical protein